MSFFLFIQASWRYRTKPAFPGNTKNLIFATQVYTLGCMRTRWEAAAARLTGSVKTKLRHAREVSHTHTWHDRSLPDLNSPARAYVRVLTGFQSCMYAPYVYRFSLLIVPGFVLWYANFFSIVVVSGLAMHALWPMVSLSLGWSIPSFYYIKVRSVFGCLEAAVR